MRHQLPKHLVLESLYTMHRWSCFRGTIIHDESLGNSLLGLMLLLKVLDWEMSYERATGKFRHAYVNTIWKDLHAYLHAHKKVDHLLSTVRSHKYERGASWIISREDFPLCLCVLFTSLPHRLSSSHFSCRGHAVACIHPLTFHANLCLSILVCVDIGEHKHIHTPMGGGGGGGPRRGACGCVCVRGGIGGGGARR